MTATLEGPAGRGAADVVLAAPAGAGADGASAAVWASALAPRADASRQIADTDRFMVIEYSFILLYRPLHYSLAASFRLPLYSQRTRRCRATPAGKQDRAYREPQDLSGLWAIIGVRVIACKRAPAKLADCLSAWRLESCTYRETERLCRLPQLVDRSIQLLRLRIAVIACAAGWKHAASDQVFTQRSSREP